MNTLYFVKFRDVEYNPIVFLLTADNEIDAERHGLQLIADQYRHEYKLASCEAVCQTPDEVSGFEPV